MSPGEIRRYEKEILKGQVAPPDLRSKTQTSTRSFCLATSLERELINLERRTSA